MPRLPPQEGLPPPLCIPLLALSVDALYPVNRTIHLLIKPDNLTNYQHPPPELNWPAKRPVLSPTLVGQAVSPAKYSFPAWSAAAAYRSPR